MTEEQLQQFKELFTDADGKPRWLGTEINWEKERKLTWGCSHPDTNNCKIEGFNDELWKEWLAWVKEEVKKEIKKENSIFVIRSGSIRLKDEVYIGESDLSIPEGVECIIRNGFCDSGNPATHRMDKVKKIIIPKSVKVIESEAFRFCRNLKEVVFKHGSEDSIEIHAGAFSQCPNLRSIDFPRKTKFVIMSGETSRSILEFSERVNVFRYSSEMEFNGDGNISVVLGKYGGKVDDWQCKYSCSTNIMFLDKVIGKGVFKSCLIGDAVFNDDNVEEIKEEAFKGAFSYIDKSPFYVPYIIKSLPKNIKKIGKYAFENCQFSEDFKFPDSLEEIEEGAFKNCRGGSIKSLPNNIKKIGKNAFEDCQFSEDFEFPNKKFRIHEEAFKGCTFKTPFKIHKFMTVDQRAFWGCKGVWLILCVSEKQKKVLVENSIADISKVDFEVAEEDF